MAKMDLLHFAGGLQTTTSSFLRQDDQLELAINVHGDEVGSLQKRLGYSRYGNAVYSDKEITGLHSYPNRSTGNTFLFAYAFGDLKYNSSGTWQTAQAGLSPTDANVEFAVLVDQLFMVGANSGGSQIATALIDDTTYSTAGNVTGAPQGNDIEAFRDRLYIVDGSTAYYSTVPTAGVITWDQANYYFTVYTGNGEDIECIHTNKSLNKLLLFKQSTLHTWDTYRLADVGTVGTTAKRSVVTCNYTTIFYNRRSNGFYAYIGTEPQLISRPIEKWVKGIQDTSVVCAGKEDEWHYLCYVGQCVVDGETYNNCAFRYSVADNIWTVYQYYDNFKCLALHEDSNVTRLYAGADDGEVHQLAYGTDTVYADDSNPIAAEIRTKNYDLGIPSERKHIDKVTIYAENPQNLTGRIRANKGDWTTHFSIDKSIKELNVNPVDGYFYQFQFSENSDVSPFKLEGLTFTPHLTTMRNA